eukprot:CAMPEP_0182464232 /NCGR_PEP_ID=MMETSP1319-20130603/8416_1 /TAXON_ID=172717 /ORGANISM="Bolidomonas pacifica, Strain RCC208" /LENGTH=99 /DNA_ID=CAMNT_0024663861 /DNA_START=174 /DNA_END=470 /DNA_ORIENTATION=-
MPSPDPSSSCYYTRLGLPKTCTVKDLKKAYRSLSLKYHPDKNPSGSEAFKAISEAYACLSDDDKRRQYDMYGAEGGANNGGPDAAAGFPRGGFPGGGAR